MNTAERQKLIKEASQKYYSNGTSPLTDAEFDALIEEERAENPNSLLLAVGHGYDISKTSGEKFPHKYGLVGSLPKCHSWDEFPKSLRDIDICATLKLDGLSCAMYYRNGVMYQALTRGNGEVGIDITDKIHTIVPQYVTLIDREFTGAVRGEILMSLDKFEEFSKTHEDAKNPRNSTAGLIGMKEVSEDLKYLTVVVYTVIGIESNQSYPFPLYPFSDYTSMHSWLVTNFGNAGKVVDMVSRKYSTANQLEKGMESLRNTWYNFYPADGIVITSNDITFNQVESGAYISYNASAFKFKAESAVTTITGIEWNLSKMKYLIPILHVEPIQLSGATVKKCAGCNAKMVTMNGWGVGARVRMLRSGEVIPYIEETLKPVAPEVPDTCPCCGTALIVEGVHLKCPNPDCRDIQIQDLLVWCNNIAPVDGLGDILKIKFFTEFLKDNISIESVYDPKNDHLIIAARFSSGDQQIGAQYRLFAQMLNSLYNNKVSIVSALKALNIPRLGDATADLLSHYPEDVVKLMNGEIPYNIAYKLGDANSRSIIQHIDKFKRLNLIKNNLVFDNENSNNSKIKVAITGALSIPRKSFEQLLNNNGFVLGDVTKDTKYLITEDPNSNSGKNAKADKLGIEKITEADFRARFNI